MALEASRACEGFCWLATLAETGGLCVLFVHAVWRDRLDYFTLTMCCYLAVMFTVPDRGIYARAPRPCERTPEGFLLADIEGRPRLTCGAEAEPARSDTCPPPSPPAEG